MMAIIVMPIMITSISIAHIDAFSFNKKGEIGNFLNNIGWFKVAPKDIRSFE